MADENLYIKILCLNLLQTQRKKMSKRSANGYRSLPNPYTNKRCDGRLPSRSPFVTTRPHAEALDYKHGDRLLIRPDRRCQKYIDPPHVFSQRPTPHRDARNSVVATISELQRPHVLEGGAQHRDVYQCFRVFVAAWIVSSAQVSFNRLLYHFSWQKVFLKEQ